jgi:hypothetical protein
MQTVLGKYMLNSGNLEMNKWHWVLALQRLDFVRKTTVYLTILQCSGPREHMGKKKSATRHKHGN